jgi:hypothetical protein
MQPLVDKKMATQSQVDSMRKNDLHSEIETMVKSKGWDTVPDNDKRQIIMEAIRKRRAYAKDIMLEMHPDLSLKKTIMQMETERENSMDPRQKQAMSGQIEAARMQLGNIAP